MNRVNIYTQDPLGRQRLEGWFDRDSALKFVEATEVNGDGNRVSRATGAEWNHETLYRTAKGRWVVHFESQWQGQPESWTFTDADHAQEWLLINGHDEAVVRYFGEVEEERGPGRPEVGAPINIRLDPDLLGRVDARAAATGTSRAATIRGLLAHALND